MRAIPGLEARFHAFAEPLIGSSSQWRTFLYPLVCWCPMRLLPFLLSTIMMSASLIELAAGQAGSAGQAASNDHAAELAGRAQEAMAAGRFDQAEAAYLELAKIEPNIAEVYSNLGAVYFQQGKLDFAIDALRHALRLKPSLVKVQPLLAICLPESGHSADALPGLEAVFRSSPDPEGSPIKLHCALHLLPLSPLLPPHP